MSSATHPRPSRDVKDAAGILNFAKGSFLFNRAVYTSSGLASQFAEAIHPMSTAFMAEAEPSLLLPPQPPKRTGRQKKRIRSRGKEGHTVASTSRARTSREKRREQAVDTTEQMLANGGFRGKDGKRTTCSFCGENGHRRFDCRTPNLGVMLRTTPSKFNELFEKESGVSIDTNANMESGGSDEEDESDEGNEEDTDCGETVESKETDEETEEETEENEDDAVEDE
mmetsp:Transcript_3773/g.10388  ORF Transcript_3773/g.10388 Transcript_3773/m.10388 type:complete len:226 (-) Transcript_3773:21-698(-)